MKMEQSIKQINKWYLGWSGYYKMTQYPSQLKRIEAHLRRRLRSRIVGQQKRRRHLYKKLVKRGVSARFAAKTVFSNSGRWELSNKFAITRAYPNLWFTHKMGQKIKSNENHPHWLPLEQWIRITWGAVYGPVRTVLWAVGNAFSMHFLWPDF